jgi:hypothetical protein
MLASERLRPTRLTLNRGHPSLHGQWFRSSAIGILARRVQALGNGPPMVWMVIRAKPRYVGERKARGGVGEGNMAHMAHMAHP